MTSLTAKLVLIALASSLSLAQCKPIGDLKQSIDPLIALPSEFPSQQQTNHHFTSPYGEQQVQYIVHHVPQSSSQPETAVHQQAPTELSGQNGQPRQEVSYVLVDPSGGTQNYQPDTPVEEDCNQKERAEYVAVPDSRQTSEARQEYPGEIVYVGQSGETTRQLTSNNQQDQENFASAVSQSSGVPATILTEIPIRDMPYEVLEKLKREYGVKVVATRERPGANLVINCDDYTGQGQTICSRQSAPANSAQVNGIYSANLLASSEEEQNHAHLQREPALIDSTGAYGVENSGPRQGTYVTRDGQTRVAGESAPQTQDSRENREGFGARTYATLDQAEPAQPERPEEVSSGPTADSGVEEKTEIQPENESHDSGFETQPVTSADEPPAEAEQADKSSL